MLKLPWKRAEIQPEPPLTHYLPSDTVDYTALPIIEDVGVLGWLRRLPVWGRIAAVVLPILLFGVGLWALVGIVNARSQPQPRPAPVVAVTQAQAVNETEIAVTGTTEHIDDGTAVNAQLLSNGAALAWADSAANTGVVQGNRFAFRIRKDQAWTQPLAAGADYEVEVRIASDPPSTSRHALDVPPVLADEFFGGEVALAATVEPTEEPTAEPTAPPTEQPTLAPTEEPTAAPTEAPTLEPTPTSVPSPVPTELPTPTIDPGPPTVAAGANATLLISPTLGSGAFARAAPGTTFQPIYRTPDSQFLLVVQNRRAGWLPASQATFDPAQLARIPVTARAKEAFLAGPLRATVRNGGNIRLLPNVELGTVLGQMRAGEVVTIKAQTANGQWYRVVAPAAQGWVSSILLSVPTGIAAAVPVGTPAEFLPAGAVIDIPVVTAVAPPAQPAQPAPPAQPAQPAPPARPAPAQNTAPTLVVQPGARLLSGPVKWADVLGAPAPGTVYRPLMRTPDSSYYLVLDGKRTGWLEARAVSIPADQITRVPVTSPPKQSVAAGPYFATVRQDANIRIGPLNNATIMGVAQEQERVSLKAKTRDGQWFRIVASAAEGWVSVGLLNIAPGAADNVPVAN